MSTSARLALRAFPPQEVHHQAMQSSDPPVMVDAFIFMAKSTIPFDVNDALRRLAAATTRTGVPTVQASVLRTMGIIMSRRGNPSLETIEAIVPTLTDMLRSHSTRVQREAAQLLVHLEADMTTWLLTHMEATHGKDALYWAKLARLHRGPWSAVQELHYLRWLVRQHDIVGGQSAGAFVQAFASRFMQDKPEAQRTALHAQLQRETLPVQAATKRAHVAHWTMDTLSGALQRDASRQVEQLQATLDGEALFREARCVECHRFRGRGGSSGPDLTGVGSRLSEADLLRAIVEPSRDVSDQYAATWIETDSGLFTGRLIDVDARRIVLDVDPFGGVESVAIGRSEIRSMEPSDVSTMPAGLLNTFDAAQIATLLDWLRRG
jgi:putative heme-binding domain-containing protein